MTYNVELTGQPDKRGLHHVMIRLHAKGQKPARIQTAIEIEARHWNPRKQWGKWVRSSHLTHASINNKIIAEYDRIKSAVETYRAGDPGISPARCKQRLQAGSVTLLRDLIELVQSRTDLSGITRQNRLYQWKRFLRWAGEDLAIEQIAPSLIEKYKKYLLSEGMAPATVNTYMTNLRILYEKGQAGRGIPKREIVANSPFLEWENLNVKQSPKGRLSLDWQAKLLEDTFELGNVGGGSARTHRNWADWARWCWLACTMQAGMRIGDLLRSRYEWYETDPEGLPVRLRYQMQKNGKWISIPIGKALRTHLLHVWQTGSPGEQYLLPLLGQHEPFARYRSYDQIRNMPPVDFSRLKARIDTVTSQLNRALKDVATQYGITLPSGARLTNHTARHSFADKVRMAIKHGKQDAKGRAVTNFDAKELLGHTNMKTTEMYFGEMDQEWLDSAMDAIVGDE